MASSLLGRLGAAGVGLRRSASTLPSVRPSEVAAAAGFAPSYAPAGVWGALKRVVGDSAAVLPPGYKSDPVVGAEVPTEVTTLSNGLRVASETVPGMGAATVGVWIDAGTRFEAPTLNGAAHFLEHLIFKGTTKRTQRELEVEVENIGAHLNAYTSREQTVYYARALKKDVPQVTELLADILQNSNVTPGAVERERGVILREMQEVDQMPEEVLFDYLHETAFQGTPLAKTILGPEQNIRSFTRDDLVSYVSTHYKPHRMVVVGAGDIAHSDLVKLSEQHFGSMPAAEGGAMTTLDYAKAEPAYLVGSEVRVRNDDMPQAHIAIAWESCGWAHPDAVAFSVLQALIGSYDKSWTTADCSTSSMTRAMAAIPNVRSVTPFNAAYTDTGLFGVYVVGEPPELDDVVYEVMRQCIGPCFKVDDVELERAKTMLKTQTLGALDGSTAIAEDIGRQVLAYGRRVPLKELFARIDAVDAEAVKRIASKYLYDREIAVAAMGPVHSLPDYHWLRKQSFWLSS